MSLYARPHEAELPAARQGATASRVRVTPHREQELVGRHQQSNTPAKAPPKTTQARLHLEDAAEGGELLASTDAVSLGVTFDLVCLFAPIQARRFSASFAADLSSSLFRICYKLPCDFC